MTFSRRDILLTAGTALGFAGCDGRERVEFFVQSDRDLPFFQPDRLSCRTGTEVHLTFRHAGKIITQLHNWVLVAPGAAEPVELAAIEAGEENGWLPKDDPRVIAATPLIKNGESVSIDFTAPAPGDYPFICTTPGHAQDMNGILHVTPA